MHYLQEKDTLQAVKKSIEALNDLFNIDLNVNPELASENLKNSCEKK